MTIERIVPHTIEWEAYYANHICRYMFASEFLRRRGVKTVLDAACGVGYGSDYLASFTNARVVGIDRSEDALRLAAQSFENPAVRFLRDDCNTLKEASIHGPYDAIVSFETIEHLQQPQRFLEACGRNVCSGGFLIVSTPNKCVTSPLGKAKNAFHETEYSPDEFVDLLANAGFVNVQLFGQCYTPIGRIRNQVRGQLRSMLSNPFVRLGRSIQSVLRGRKFGALLPETLDDFEVKSFQCADEISRVGVDGPFAIIAITPNKPRPLT